jgi:GT2 family glycosyltransferase
MKVSGESEVAIIIPCRNESIYLKQTLDFLLLTEVKYLCNIIIVDDHSTDNCCKFIKKSHDLYNNVSLIHTKGIGAAGARNLGVQIAEAAKILVFCDAHILVQKNWLNSLLSAFENNEVSAVCPGIGSFNPKSPVGYGQSWNNELEVIWLKKPADIKEVPLAPGGCFAIRKEAFDSVGGFDRDFRSWGFEDVELSLKLWLLGYKIYVDPGVRVGHKFRKVQPYEVNLTEFHYNKLRMAISHFNLERLNKVINTMQGYPNFKQIQERLAQSDAFTQRADYFKSRLHDDDWFFNKFNIAF